MSWETMFVLDNDNAVEHENLPNLLISEAR